jgi:hypothetical protein
VQGALAAVLRMGLSEADFQYALTLICSSALQAGGNEDQITRGALNAGVSNNDIANAIAQARTSPAPVFGYSAPAPAVTAPISGWTIGGRTFGSRAASPYTP